MFVLFVLLARSGGTLNQQLIEVILDLLLLSLHGVKVTVDSFKVVLVRQGLRLQPNLRSEVNDDLAFVS